ncbi:SDR family NAD(P)-dependent oxidoreductase [Intrasporangium sp.]|uniref:SDR family NAD(P)-dependent oxidoreductase n=1 Tax=Intrasporangium sp. TaxID=1925024 RepID=UPI003221E20A
MTRTALVVGAGQGMGRAIACRLAATTGTHVHLGGRTTGKLRAVADEIQNAGGSCEALPFDATDRDQVEAAIGGIGTRLDIVVHTVGRSMMRSFDETTVQDWEEQISANLSSAFHVAQVALPLLRASDNPSLILITSKTALKGYPVVAYSAAKAGVLGMARALSVELAPERIRVVPICPGPVDTPMRWAATPDMDRSLVIGVENIAATVAYLVDLERGVTVDTLLVQSAQYD